MSSNSLFLVQSCICMNTQYYYSRHGEHTAVSSFYQFSHCKNVKTKTQGVMKSLLQPSSGTWCSKFWTGSSHFQACRLSPGTIRLHNQGNQRGRFQPFHAWGLSLGSAWLWELLKWPEIGNNINRKLIHKGDQEWAQQACRLWGWARTCCSLLWVLQNVERRVFQGTECLERQFMWLHP